MHDVLAREIDMVCEINAKLRNSQRFGKQEIARLISHIEAIQSHVVRVENHSNMLSARYENSLSWKLTAPVRKSAAIAKTLRGRSMWNKQK